MKGLLPLLKGLKDLKRAAGIMKVVIAVTVTLVIVTGIVLNTYSGNMGRQLSDSLFRLHVIANSDSPEDQSLKRDVRDAVLSYMHQKLADSKDIVETKSIINSNLGKIESIAREVILKEGKGYNIKTTLGNYPFPTKSYGDITLPAGNYQALRLIIGNGKGANWWCVLFPPLCFVDVTHGTVPDSVKEDLKDALSEEEYGILTSADEESDIPIKIKFKIVELFQDSKIKFTGAFNKIFNIPG
jgi:stage II sporulation protein R